MSISPNMNLILPTVGATPGPEWATDLNASLTLVDQHDHSSGSGVKINPNGLDINSDLSLQANNLTAARSLRMNIQAAPLAGSSDLGCLYVSGVDLYFNDELGNQIQITDNGGVGGTPGSISNLVAPASAAYVSGTETFVWQSDANTAANMDFRSAILRNSTASSFGLTLQAPTLSGDYTITLPALPASQKIMTLDNTGLLSAPYVVDNSTIEISSNTIRVKDAGITEAKLANLSVSTAKIQALAVTEAKIADREVTSIKIAVGGVTTTNILDANVTPAKLSAVQTGQSTVTGAHGTGAIASVTITTVASRAVIITVGTADGLLPTSTVTWNNYTIQKNVTIMQTLASVAGSNPLGTITFIDTSPPGGSTIYKFNAGSAGTLTGTVRITATQV